MLYDEMTPGAARIQARHEDEMERITEAAEDILRAQLRVPTIVTAHVECPACWAMLAAHAHECEHETLAVHAASCQPLRRMAREGM